MGIDEERLGEGVLSVQEVSCQRPISNRYQTTLRRSQDVAKRDMIRGLCALLVLFGMSWPTSADNAKPLTAILLVARAELPDSTTQARWGPHKRCLPGAAAPTSNARSAHLLHRREHLFAALPIARVSDTRLRAPS